MDFPSPTTVLLIVLQVSAVIVLIVALLAFGRTLSVYRTLRRREGSHLAKTLTGAIAGFTLAQLISTLIIAGLLARISYGQPYTSLGLFLVEQLVFIVTGIWATWRMSRF